MEKSNSRLVKYPTIPAFSMKEYYHPKKIKIPLATKPVLGKILILRGPSGAGKTTISQLLVEEYPNKVKAFHLGFERRKVHLGFSVHDKKLLLCKLKKRIDLALKKYKFIILDEMFDFEGQFLTVRENHLHAKILVIYLDLPMSISIKRASSRNRGKYYTPLKKEHIEGLWYLAHFVKCGKIVNSNKNIDDVLQKVISILRKEEYL